MKNEFTAIVERDGPWHIAYCPEIPGANGEGRTKAVALKSLSSAIALIPADRRKDGLRGVPASASERRLSWVETWRLAPTPQEARLQLEERGAIPLPVDQSHDRIRRGRAAAKEISEMLARKICRGLAVPEIGW